MKTNFYLLFTLLNITLLSSCGKNAAGPALEISATSTAGPAEVYFEGPGNEVRNAKAALGRRLFYDKRLSVSGSTACAGCHKPEAAFGDNIRFSIAADGEQLLVNTPALLAMRTADNSGSWGWGRQQTSFRKYIFDGAVHQKAMGFTDVADAEKRIRSLVSYASLIANATVSGEQEPLMSDALGHFVVALGTMYKGGPYQLDVEPVAATVAAPIVTQTITRFQCSYCHGVASKGIDGDGDGAPEGLHPGTTNGAGHSGIAFKIPTFNNVALTAPYMHDGSLASIEDVLDNYSSGSSANQSLHPRPMDASGKLVQLSMSSVERQAIMQYLNSFTDRRRMEDPRFSNPFAVARN